MKRLFFCIAAAALVATGPGCSHIPFIGKKRPKAMGQTEKMNPHVATQVQIDFQQRWIEKRTNDLVGQGMPSAAARAKAEAEFDQQYNFANPQAGAGK